MEGLSAAASSIAVVSLAIQLADSVKKLCDFWESIKEAPSDIKEISTDLELLSGVLTDIAYEAQHVGPNATLLASLDACSFKVKRLVTLLNEIEPGFASTSSRVRKWTAFKAVLKSGKLTKFQEALERLKGTLLLVQQNQNSRLGRNRHITLEQSLVTITQGISGISMKQPSQIAGRLPGTASALSNHSAFRAEERHVTDDSAGGLYLVPGEKQNSSGPWSARPKQAKIKRNLRGPESATGCFLGTIRATSSITLSTTREADSVTSCRDTNQEEYETSYMISPAPWLMRLGIHYGIRFGLISSSTQGWKSTLSTVRRVPDDALIFQFCRQGNVHAVRTLLSEGHASIRDTDSEEYTPLHFAAENYHPELCRFLMDAGADVNSSAQGMPYEREWTPVNLAAHKSTTTTHTLLSEVFDTLRLFIDSMDFSYQDGDGWGVLFALCESKDILGYGDTDAKICLLLWMLRLSSFELKTYAHETQWANLLHYTFISLAPQTEASGLLLNVGGSGLINVPPYGSDGYTILHSLIVYCECDVSLVLERGPDLHQLGLDNDHTPYKESPTSLAMYSSWAFSYWLRGLVNHGVNLENFVDQELERNPMVHPGWGRTLHKLFAHDHRPDLHSAKFWTCSDCNEDIQSLRVQPHWTHFLEDFKLGLHRDSTALPISRSGEEEITNLDTRRDAVGTAGDAAIVDHDELPPRPKLEEGPGENHTTMATRPTCKYFRDEVVCRDCWLYYERTGTRYQPSNDEDSSENESSSSQGDSSEDEFSPFHIHS